MIDTAIDRIEAARLEGCKYKKPKPLKKKTFALPRPWKRKPNQQVTRWINELDHILTQEGNLNGKQFVEYVWRQRGSTGRIMNRGVYWALFE